MYYVCWGWVRLGVGSSLNAFVFAYTPSIPLLYLHLLENCKNVFPTKKIYFLLSSSSAAQVPTFAGSFVPLLLIHSFVIYVGIAYANVVNAVGWGLIRILRIWVCSHRFTLCSASAFTYFCTFTQITRNRSWMLNFFGNENNWCFYTKSSWFHLKF